MRRSLLACFVVAAAWLLAAGRAEAAKIIVSVDGLRSGKGNVYVALYSKPDEFPDGNYSDAHVQVRASRKPITVVFDHLKPGRYAVGAFHDENANHELDTNFFGYPVEGYALSNGVHPLLSRPSFVDASFPVGTGDKRVELKIRY